MSKTAFGIVAHCTSVAETELWPFIQNPSGWVQVKAILSFAFSTMPAKQHFWSFLNASAAWVM
jgi:hypothetical protein